MRTFFEHNLGEVRQKATQNLINDKMTERIDIHRHIFEKVQKSFKNKSQDWKKQPFW